MWLQFDSWMTTEGSSVSLFIFCSRFTNVADAPSIWSYMLELLTALNRCFYTIPGVLQCKKNLLLFWLRFIRRSCILRYIYSGWETLLTPFTLWSKKKVAKISHFLLVCYSWFMYRFLFTDKLCHLVWKWYPCNSCFFFSPHRKTVLLNWTFNDLI